MTLPGLLSAGVSGDGMGMGMGVGPMGIMAFDGPGMTPPMPNANSNSNMGSNVGSGFGVGGGSSSSNGNGSNSGNGVGVGAEKDKGKGKEIDWADDDVINSQSENLNQLMYADAFMSTEGPNTWKQAMKRDDRELWTAAAKDEMASHQKNGTWALVKQPDTSRRIVKCRWVFAIKSDG